MYKYLLVVCLATFCAFTAKAQKPDTNSKSAIVKTGRDTIKSTRHDTIAVKEPKVKRERIYHPDSTHSPHTAVIRSLLLPGLGQIYNHRWWKVPVIYGVLGLLGDAIIYNNKYYEEFLALSKAREYGTTPKPTDKYYTEEIGYAQQPSQALYDETDSFRRDRDLSILGVAGFWAINAIDAYIDAKFIQSYSVDNNLSMRIEPDYLKQPVFAQNTTGSFIPAIKITFTF